MDKPKRHRRTWGSVKAMVANRRFMTANEIHADTGVAKRTIYHTARRLGFKLPSSKVAKP